MRGTRNPKNNRSEKRKLECQKRPKLVEEIQKCKRLKFDSERALLTRKIQFEEEKSKIRCLWTQLNLI
jgi:hypothetical protein